MTPRSRAPRSRRWLEKAYDRRAPESYAPVDLGGCRAGDRRALSDGLDLHRHRLVHRALHVVGYGLFESLPRRVVCQIFFVVEGIICTIAGQKMFVPRNPIV